MKLALASLSLLLASCASGPSVDPIDNALLAKVSAAGKASVNEARAARDAATDTYALRQSETRTAQQQVALAEASLATVRSQLNETKLAAELAAKNDSKVEVEHAEARHKIALTEADYHRDLLALRKRELEAAVLNETLALEETRVSTATVELKKAEALQDVDSMAAQQIPIKDHRRQVAYHRQEAATARARAELAAALLDEARGNLADEKRKLDTLKKQ
tara:strand:- start:85 stop:744 length:660 start_codon:yes stop_codon:yes gene_type:complete